LARIPLHFYDGGNFLNENPLRLLFGIPIFFLLSFHIIPSRLKVFPKDNFTFSNTIITEDDISGLIQRYNNATFFEKAAIRNEALPKKLIEKGIIEAGTSK
jgi:hypothetical protein